MSNYLIFPIFLYFLCSSCQASEGETNLGKYLEREYILQTLEETREIIHSNLKEIFVTQNLGVIGTDEAKTIAISFGSLEERFTNIAMAKLRLDPGNVSRDVCNYFQLGVKAGVTKNSMDEVAQCLDSSCPKNKQVLIIEELFLKTAQLDKDNSACLELFSSEKKQ